MTVRCIPLATQMYYCRCYVSNAMTINEIAEETETSRRTVIRMLVERGIDVKINHRRSRKLTTEQKQIPLLQREESDENAPTPSELRKVLNYLNKLFRNKVPA
ncbi:hypothetical protein [Xenophilus sp. Marseille-Q4582]|uniref:hypothetical protein n=1 Tax=Xenophilus sp. Marseille-Q4582 TaxID=2866600 RepID=UPI001CE3CE99|nr:hypothetical protein [Xenophilus sp. Marseille-Q4582]